MYCECFRYPNRIDASPIITHSAEKNRSSFTSKGSIILPACNPATELDELDVDKSLGVIANFAYYNNESRVGIKSFCGAEAIAKVMLTFPKYHDLQWSACCTLCNSENHSIGKKNALEAGGMKLLLTALNSHQGFTAICVASRKAFHYVIKIDKENIELFLCRIKLKTSGPMTTKFDERCESS
jgi:hypothetical protein